MKYIAQVNDSLVNSFILALQNKQVELEHVINSFQYYDLFPIGILMQKNVPMTDIQIIPLPEEMAANPITVERIQDEYINMLNKHDFIDAIAPITDRFFLNYLLSKYEDKREEIAQPYASIADFISKFYKTEEDCLADYCEAINLSSYAKGYTNLILFSIKNDNKADSESPARD